MTNGNETIWNGGANIMERCKISQQFRKAVQDQNMDDEAWMVCACVNNECGEPMKCYICG